VIYVWKSSNQHGRFVASALSVAVATLNDITCCNISGFDSKVGAVALSVCTILSNETLNETIASLWGIVTLAVSTVDC
jgi:hypothetical protein